MIDQQQALEQSKSFGYRDCVRQVALNRIIESIEDSSCQGGISCCFDHTDYGDPMLYKWVKEELEKLGFTVALDKSQLYKDPNKNYTEMLPSIQVYWGEQKAYYRRGKWIPNEHFKKELKCIVPLKNFFWSLLKWVKN